MAKKITMEDLLGVLTPEQLKLKDDWENYLSTNIHIKEKYSIARLNHGKTMLHTYIYFNLLTKPSNVCASWYLQCLNLANINSINNVNVNNLKTIENFYAVSLQEKISLDNLIIIYKDTEIIINSIYNDKDITVFANKTYSLLHLIKMLTEGLNKTVICNIVTSFNSVVKKFPCIKDLITVNSNTTANIYLLGKDVKKILFYLMPTNNKFYNINGECCYTAAGVSHELYKYGIAYSRRTISSIVCSDTPVLLGISITPSIRDKIRGVTRKQLKTICLNTKYYIPTDKLLSYNYLLDKEKSNVLRRIVHKFKDKHKIENLNLNSLYVLKSHGVLLETFLQPYVDELKKKELQLAS